MDRITFGHTTPLDLVFLLRFFCCICTIAIIIARLIPASRRRFLNYGARTQPAAVADPKVMETKGNESPGLLDKLASLDVPHSWFAHFYVLSLVLSLFWLMQITFHTPLLRAMIGHMQQRQQMQSSQACTLCVILMVLQSVRRLWESWRFSEKSKSRMWIGHYVFGLTFYFVVNIAVWIEGFHQILSARLEYGSWMKVLKQPRVQFGLTAYFLASFAQYLAHAYLASLQKYSIPRHWLFHRLIAPHYTAECVIYCALAIVGAPEQCLFNGSLMFIVLLTAVNLGITAHNTREWMLIKFRESHRELAGRYCMLPGLW